MKITWEAKDLKLMPPQKVYRKGNKEEKMLGYMVSGKRLVLISLSDGMVSFCTQPLSPEDMAQYLTVQNYLPVEMREYLESIDSVDRNGVTL